MKEIKVLLVDNREIVRKGLARLLQDQPSIAVVQQCGSEQALDHVRDSSPNLVLMDTHGMESGVTEVIKKITSASPEVKVALLSDTVDEKVLFSCVEAGASGYLVNDLSVQDLIKSIDLIASGRMVISPRLSGKFIGEFTELRKSRREAARSSEAQLSPRETEILAMVAGGSTNKEIAGSLCITENTAKVHVKNILSKLKLRNRQQAAAYAVEHGIPTTPDTVSADG